MDKYTIERDGQLDFYNRFLPRVDPSLNVGDIIADNNDGVLNGNLLEFKLHVTDINAALFQCVKYLSALRVKGKPVPASVHIVDLNAAAAWHFHSEAYLPDIEKTYSGGASKRNGGFLAGKPVHTLRYGENPLDAETLIQLLKERHFTRIHIDENCIVGWASAYYNAVPMARKEDFLGDDTGAHKTIGEIRKPRVFADYIYPYAGGTNVRFQYLMDRLNDTLQKKNLGAFYTPPPYAEKALELVRKAIARVPKGNDYIILDRCAGTGNLEAGLTDEELSHCVVSTVEYYEYKVLQELLGAKVRHIIPAFETGDTFDRGLVTGADALSEAYVNHPVLRQYVDNPGCTVILFENPPYSEVTSIEHQKRKARETSNWKRSFVMEEMRGDCAAKGSARNDLGNLFIWSAFKHYLRQPTDSYIVFSPVKYWKAQHLIDRKFLGGFAFNRRHFHTNIDACVMVALWSNEPADMEEIYIDAYDINENAPPPPPLEFCGNLPVRRIHSIYSRKYYDKRPFSGSSDDGILTGLNGLEAETGVKKRIVPVFSHEMLGYLVADSVGFDNPDAKSSLLIAGRYNGNGFFLHKDNYLEKLPMFAASRYVTYNRAWTERGRIMKSADGAERYAADVASGKLTAFLLKCLLFACLEKQNHMRSFTGSDGRFYRNELCLDDTNGATLATRDLQSMKRNERESALFAQWDSALQYAKATEHYRPALTYGVYQISTELDASHTDETTGVKVWDNVELHSALQALKKLLKEYYNAEIVPFLFEYEFLK